MALLPTVMVHAQVSRVKVLEELTQWFTNETIYPSLVATVLLVSLWQGFPSLQRMMMWRSSYIHV